MAAATARSAWAFASSLRAVGGLYFPLPSRSWCNMGYYCAARSADMRDMQCGVCGDLIGTGCLACEEEPHGWITCDGCDTHYCLKLACTMKAPQKCKLPQRACGWGTPYSPHPVRGAVRTVRQAILHWMRTLGPLRALQQLCVGRGVPAPREVARLVQ